MRKRCIFLFKNKRERCTNISFQNIKLVVSFLRPQEIKASQVKGLYLPLNNALHFSMGTQSPTSYEVTKSTLFHRIIVAVSEILRIFISHEKP